MTTILTQLEQAAAAGEPGARQVLADYLEEHMPHRSLDIKLLRASSLPLELEAGGGQWVPALTVRKCEYVAGSPFLYIFDPFGVCTVLYSWRPLPVPESFIEMLPEEIDLTKEEEADLSKRFERAAEVVAGAAYDRWRKKHPGYYEW
jgi:hypothetical protein